jgi:hypothetical protein
VTDYRWEAFWVGRWNPLARPYLAYRYVGRTRWVASTETVKTPVICRRIVPQTRTVQVPVTTQRMVEEEVISRVAISAAPSSKAPWSEPARMAQASSLPHEPGAIGGVARLDSDPPAVGTTTAWRASSQPRR